MDEQLEAVNYVVTSDLHNNKQQQMNLINVHNLDEDNFLKYLLSPDKPSGGTFNCLEKGCYESFNSRSDLNKHKTQYHCLMFQCLYCKLFCESMRKLDLHQQLCLIKRESPSTTEQSTQQPMVSWDFEKESDQQNEDAFKCPIIGCDRVFKTYSSLYYHKNMHLGRFRCGECGKCCQSKLHFDEHQVKHTNQRPYRCKRHPQCQQRFKYRNYVYKHCEKWHQQINLDGNCSETQQLHDAAASTRPPTTAISTEK